MNKKLKLICFFIAFTLIIIIIPNKVTAELILTCEYNVEWETEPVMSYPFKMELSKNENNEVSLIKYSWYDGQYNKVDAYGFFGKPGEKGGYSIYTTTITAENVYEIYNEIGECPYIVTNSRDSDLTLKLAKDTSLETLDHYKVSKGTTTIYQNESSGDDLPQIPTIKKVCAYELEANVLGNKEKISLQFYMKSNGNKYWSVETPSKGKAERIINQNNILTLQNSQGITYSLILEEGVISDILIQKTMYEFNQNEYQCIAPEKLGLYQNGIGNEIEYLVTTDEEKLKEEDISSTLTPPVTTDTPSVTPTGQDCTSLLGNPTVSGTPAYYLSIVFQVIKYVAIVILIVFTIMDFVGAVASQDNEQLKKATSKAVIRLILCIVIFILPTLIEFVLQFIDNRQISICISVGGN